MLYELLTRTWLWLYWFVEYRSFHEYECGLLQEVDCEDLLKWMSDFLNIDSWDYDYSEYDEF